MWVPVFHTDVWVLYSRVSGGQDEHGAKWRHWPGSSFTSLLIIIIVLVLLCWQRVGVGVSVNWITKRGKRIKEELVEKHTCPFKFFTLQYGIGGWKDWHIHGGVVRVGQPDNTVGTVMSNVPVAI